MSDPILVLADGDLAVFYIEGRGECALTVFTEDNKHNLAGALGAIRQIAPSARVRYRPTQGTTPRHIIVNFRGDLAPDIRQAHAGAFVEAIKLLG